MADRVLILGASARAAAASARRAGLAPFAIDLFADRDTKQICDVLRCPFEDYPEGLFRLARTAPPMPWMYTGGLENYPELVGELAKERELWGNGPDVLRRVRDPRILSEELRHSGLIHPTRILPGEMPPTDGEWLRKPRRGAGGLGVRVADRDEMMLIGEFGCDFFLEEYVPGEVVSVAFVSRNQPVDFLGSTYHLSGTPWLHAARFAYCGNIFAPRGVGLDIPRFSQSLGELWGVWGIDLIRSQSGLVALEINPRYTASLEVTEWSTGVNPLRFHQWAATRSPAPFFPKSWPDDERDVVGKAIYYAPAQLTFPDSGPWDDSLARAADVWTRPDFADIPHAGDVIEPGQPVLTILTGADSEDACLANLKARAAELDRLFGVAAGGP